MAETPNSPPAPPPAPTPTPPATPPAPTPPAPPAAPPDDAEVDRAAGREPKPVPYDRFKEVVNGKKAAEAKAAEFERSHATAAARIAELERELGNVRIEARNAKAQAEIGVQDPADIAAFISAYDKAHEKVDATKRPTMAAWRDALAGDEKAAAESGLPASWRKAYLAPVQPAKSGQPQAFNRDAGVQQPSATDFSKLTPAERVALTKHYMGRR